MDARKLHEQNVVVDCHNDLVLMLARKAQFGIAGHFSDYWLGQLRSGGVNVQVLPIYVESSFPDETALRGTLLLTERIHRVSEEHPEDVSVCVTGAQIDEAVGQGRIAFVIALEGCSGIGKDVDLLETFARLGVRMVSFTHFGRTALGDGSAEDGTGGRLSRAGVEALGKLESLGVLMDVSHLSIAGTEHVLELATRPVIASHSGARELCDHHRNLSNEAIKGVAATGGVVGVNLFPWFIDSENPTIDGVVDHIEHVINVAGPDHVGLGPDFVREYLDDYYKGYLDVKFEGLPIDKGIEGLTYTAELPNLTEAMVRRGLPEGDIVKVLGGNFMRVFREVMGVPK